MPARREPTQAPTTPATKPHTMRWRGSKSQGLAWSSSASPATRVRRRKYRRVRTRAQGAYRPRVSNSHIMLRKHRPAYSKGRADSVTGKVTTCPCGKRGKGPCTFNRTCTCGTWGAGGSSCGTGPDPIGAGQITGSNAPDAIGSETTRSTGGSSAGGMLPAEAWRDSRSTRRNARTDERTAEEFMSR